MCLLYCEEQPKRDTSTFEKWSMSSSAAFEIKAVQTAASIFSLSIIRGAVRTAPLFIEVNKNWQALLLLFY